MTYSFFITQKEDCKICPGETFYGCIFHNKSHPACLYSSVSHTATRFSSYFSQVHLKEDEAQIKKMKQKPLEELREKVCLVKRRVNVLQEFKQFVPLPRALNPVAFTTAVKMAEALSKNAPLHRNIKFINAL